MTQLLCVILVPHRRLVRALKKSLTVMSSHLLISLAPNNGCMIVAAACLSSRSTSRTAASARWERVLAMMVKLAIIVAKVALDREANVYLKLVWPEDNFTS